VTPPGGAVNPPGPAPLSGAAVGPDRRQCPDRLGPPGIRQFVPATFFDNWALFDRFPNYVFNYEGAIHYMWFKEYHPDAWVRLQKYVALGRWQLSGSWVNAADPNVPSPEALMRQALYGKRFFRQEFGKVPQDIYLTGTRIP
jgi:alpha-mannosidase